MKKLLLSFVFLLVLAGLVNGAFTTSPTSLSVSGQEDLTFTRNISVVTDVAPADNLVFASNYLTYTQTNFEDKQGDKITFTFTQLGTVNAGTTAPFTLTTNIAENVKVGTYTGTLTLTASEQATPATTHTSQIPVTVRVDPEMCKDGRVSDGTQDNDISAGDLQIDISEPDDGDNFGPGDEIRLDVNVENNADTDLDVVVEARLYNIDQDSEIATVESDSVDIDEDKDEDIELTLKVPTSDSDLDEDDDFVLFIKVYEDGDEDQYCNYDALDMDFERDSNDVAVNSVTVNPSVAMCSDTVNVAVEVQNVGTNDQDSVQVTVKETSLGMELRSEVFSLDEFDKSDDTALKAFTFEIPSNAKGGDYFLDTRVFFRSSSSDSILTKLTLTSCQGPLTSEDVLSLTQSTFTATQGSVFTIPLTLKNPGSQTVTFSVDVVADNGWADSSTERISVAGGEETTVYAYLTPKPSLSSGVYTATVNVKQDSTVVATEKVTVNVGSQGPTGGTTYQPSITASGVWRNLSQSTAFWIAAVVIIFTLVVYVLSALLRPK